MKRIASFFASLVVAALLVGNVSAAESKTKPATEQVCPITGKPANPSITTEYEGVTYAFADDAAREKFKQARKDSLYEKLGGKAGLDAVVDRFYEKIVADKRISHIFEEINMHKQIRRQKQFLAAAFGGPIPWTGRDLRKAHEDMGLTEVHFNAVAEHLQSSLEEFKVKKELIDQVMAIVGGTRDHVLNRPTASK